MEEFLQKKYINPLTDFGFKKLFFNESNKELLIDFLNEILQEQNRITDIQLQPTLHLGHTENNRKVVFDIFCITDKGEYLIVEMQKARQPYFKDRCLFYSTFPIRQQAPQGRWNFQLRAVYTIAILDFVLFEEFEDDKNYYIERVQLVRERTKTPYSGKLKFIFVELPKFDKNISELKTNMDRWLYCMKNLSLLDSCPFEEQGKIFERLFKIAEINQLTEEEMEEYKKSIFEYEDVQDALEYAKEVAKKEGWDQGIEKEKIEIAKNCIKEGIPIEVIVKITGLTSIQIQELI